MNLSEPLLISPLLDGFVMGDPISNHFGVRACPAMHLESEQKHIVKIISLPAAQSQLEAMLLAGAFSDRESALSYYKELADGVEDEAKLLQKLARNEGFVAFDDWQTVPMESGETGYDVYLLSQYRPTLENALRNNEMTHLQGINLGLDLCAALCVARRFGYLYSNLRPANVFICNEREFRIGDLGFISLDSLKYASLPDKYHSDYTPPEISDAYSALNLTMDTYAAGLILYQAYNDGLLPPIGGTLAAPRYADADLAEIILKACALDPQERWPDPMQMGQALASYMQTHTVNDVPIVPPAPVEEVPEVVEVENSEPSTTDILAEVDGALDVINAVLAAAEGENATEEADTAEAADAEDSAADEAESTDENEGDVGEMLAQADHLIANLIPETPEESEPEEIPAPIIEEEPAAEEPVLEEQSSDAEKVPEFEEPAVITKPAEALPVLEDAQTDETEPKSHLIKIDSKKLTIAMIITAVLLILGTCIAVFYQNFYLQKIEDIVLIGDENSLTVQLVTDIPSEKLSVICTDTHGNALTARVENGVAVFNNLKPGASYTIEVQIDGTHKLQGQIKETYSTTHATIISGFYATTGLEDGSITLYFTAQGPDSTDWSVRYTADGEEEKTAVFNDHRVTLTGLTVGKEYTFSLVAPANLYITGMDTIKHTISRVIYPEDVKALGFTDQGLGITWKAPDGVTVSSWIVRCYNDAGYNETLTTEETYIYFTGLDSTANYTIEVKAEGMTLGTRIYVTANAVSIQNLQADASDPTALRISWKANGNIPTNGWLLVYTVENGAQQVIECKSMSGVIKPLIPGAHYRISIQSSDGSTVFDGNLEYDAPAANTFEGFLVNASNMTFSMCKVPSKDNWNHNDLTDSDYTTTFKLGQKAAFVAHLDRKTSKVDDKITTLYVIRDHEGNLVSAKTEIRTWDEMWNDRWGEYIIPTMPSDAGRYTVEIYFEGAIAFTQEFSITAAG